MVPEGWGMDGAGAEAGGHMCGPLKLPLADGVEASLVER